MHSGRRQELIRTNGKRKAIEVRYSGWCPCPNDSAAFAEAQARDVFRGLVSSKAVN